LFPSNSFGAEKYDAKQHRKNTGPVGYEFGGAGQRLSPGFAFINRQLETILISCAYTYSDSGTQFSPQLLI
jgi:hypothetical protein